MRTAQLAVVVLLGVVAGVPAAAPPPKGPAVPDLRPLLEQPRSEVAEVARRYEADRGSLQRTYPILASPTRRARLEGFYAGWLAALEKLDAARLSQQGQAELASLKKAVERDRQELEAQARRQAEVAGLLPFGATIIDLEESRRRMEPVDAAAAAGRVAAMKKQVDALLGAPKNAPAQTANRAAEDLARLRSHFEHWFDFYNGYDPVFTWWMAEPYREADQALERYADFLRKKPSDKEEKAPAATTPEKVPVERATLHVHVPDLAELMAAPTSEMQGVIRRYQTDRVRFGRFAGATVPLPAAPRSARQAKLGRAWLAALDKLDFERLGHDGRIDYLLLRQHLRRDLARAELPANAPAPRGTGRPIGQEALQVELAGEMIPYTPEELLAIAEKEFAWCEGEMKKAAGEMGFADWRKAVEKVKTLHVEPGKQPALIRSLATEAIDYLRKHDLVTVPALAEESWRMEMMSPQRQLVNPFFTGGEVISVSFPTSTMSHEAKLQSMRGNNVHFSRATVHHELIPGHHLQGFMTARYRSHRGAFATPFWVEGWALYWEMLLYQRGFAKTPEDRVGFLFWRMHRCARIVFSLGFHLGKMTSAQCVDLLVERVGHERDNAAAEVRRSFAGGYGPLYQAAYMLGGLQIRALREELVGPGKMTDRTFHDLVLKENRIPIALVRASLTRQKLTRDGPPAWRFYDR